MAAISGRRTLLKDEGIEPASLMLRSDDNGGRGRGAKIQPCQASLRTQDESNALLGMVILDSTVVDIK
jgi:hypothetical protein